MTTPEDGSRDRWMVFEPDELGLAPVGGSEESWETFATEQEALDSLVYELELRIRQYWHGIVDFHEIQSARVVLPVTEWPAEGIVTTEDGLEYQLSNYIS